MTSRASEFVALLFQCLHNGIDDFRQVRNAHFVCVLRFYRNNNKKMDTIKTWLTQKKVIMLRLMEADQELFRQRLRMDPDETDRLVQTLVDILYVSGNKQPNDGRYASFPSLRQSIFGTLTPVKEYNPRRQCWLPNPRTVTCCAMIDQEGYRCQNPVLLDGGLINLSAVFTTYDNLSEYHISYLDEDMHVKDKPLRLNTIVAYVCDGHQSELKEEYFTQTSAEFDDLLVDETAKFVDVVNSLGTSSLLHVDQFYGRDIESHFLIQTILKGVDFVAANLKLFLKKHCQVQARWDPKKIQKFLDKVQQLKKEAPYLHVITDTMEALLNEIKPATFIPTTVVKPNLPHYVHVPMDPSFFV